MEAIEVQSSATPELSLPDANGRVITLKEFRGRPLLVSFLSHAA